ncbi:hypothetical protein IIA79_01470 [bacterium]|nr:hypothetical protein [bacterium]
MDVVRLNVALSEGSDPAAFDSKMQQDFKVLTEIGLDSIRHFTRGELAAELGLDTLPKETRIVDKRPGT